MQLVINFLLLSILLFSCKKEDTPTLSVDKQSEQKTINLTIDGNDRSFIVYLPTGYNNAGKMPLIFVIHGGSGTPEGMINLAISNQLPIETKLYWFILLEFKKIGMMDDPQPPIK